MKRWTWMLAALSLVLLLVLAASCGAKSGPEKTDTFSFGKHTFAVKVEVTETILASLGEQTKAPEEAPNCAFDGKGKLYTFSGFEVETYAKDGKNYFYGIYLLDDSLSTDKAGITIGSTKDDVTAAYGKPSDEKEGSLTYKKDGFSLVFFLRDGRVTRIHYLFDV